MPKRGIMSQRLKEEIAKELGFFDVVEREGWGGINARDAGNMVKRAIEIAEQGLAEQEQAKKQKQADNRGDKAWLNFSALYCFLLFL